ncbi:hypothetical protein OS035_30255, partial [Rhizobium sp. 268]|uniref:hypothetical protein n=1 Tax=Rhizobium sp. 268 TaxID=2996375 RepID=UPI002F94D6BB
RKTRALVIVKVKNLQRGTANAVVLGEKPQDASAERNMVLPWAGFNAFLCMPAMRRTIFLRRSISWAGKGKKRGPLENQGPYKCEGQKPPEGNS